MGFNDEARSAAVEARSGTRSRQLRNVEDYDPRDIGEKGRMIGKLFALYPPQPDVELRLEAYLEELRGIPWRWVSRAMADLTEEPGRVFCPSISELKGAIAKRIRQQRIREAQAGVDTTYIAHRASGGEDDNQIGWLRQVVSNDLERGLLPKGVEPQHAKEIAPPEDDDGDWTTGGLW